MPPKSQTRNLNLYNKLQALCSHVIRAMCRRFPGAVDKLPEERAHFAGPPPVCLATADLDAAAQLLFTGEVRRCNIKSDDPRN